MLSAKCWQLYIYISLFSEKDMILLKVCLFRLINQVSLNIYILNSSYALHSNKNVILFFYLYKIAAETQQMTHKSVL